MREKTERKSETELDRVRGVESETERDRGSKRETETE